MGPAFQVVGHALVPYGAAVAAAVIGCMARLTPAANSYIQHVAAGVVFSAAAVELVPQILQQRDPLFTAIGFSVAVGVFVLLRKFSGNLAAVSISYLGAIALDLVIDGFVLSIGFRSGAKQGTLLTVALTIEMVSLGLALTAELLESKKSRMKAIAIAVLICAALLGGAAAGPFVLTSLPAAGLHAVIAFGTAAWLYLVTEELLREAHERVESAAAAALFFVGFLAILLLEMAQHSS